LFTETKTAPASPTRNDTLRFALIRNVSPSSSVRPASDSPSIVVRSHEDRRASTSSDRLEEGAVALAAEAGEDVDDVADVTGGAAVDDAVAAGGVVVDRAAADAEDPSDERSHQKTVPATTTTPMTPKSATKVPTRFPDGTGTASLGNGDDNSTRDVAVDSGGPAAVTGGIGGGGEVMNGSSSIEGSGGGINAGVSLSA
jgi:hypothetical protein